MQKDEPEIGPHEAADIKSHVRRLLRDLGNPEPPLDLNIVRDRLKLDLAYYSKEDLTLLDEFAHKMRVAGQYVGIKATSMAAVIKKSGLRAFLLKASNQRRIFIDDQLPDLKHRHIQAHEIIHDITPWHQSLLLGDNEISLNPYCHQMMEAEANYGARQLMFLVNRFTQEVRDSPLSWSLLQSMSKAFGNTLTTILWQTIHERSPTQPTFGLISRHPIHPSIGDPGTGSPIRYFIRSDAFKKRFPTIKSADVYRAVATYVTGRKRGPVGEDIVIFKDVTGQGCDFEMHSFCNSYDLLTFGFFQGAHKLVVGL